MVSPLEPAVGVEPTTY